MEPDRADRSLWSASLLTGLSSSSLPICAGKEGTFLRLPPAGSVWKGGAHAVPLNTSN